MNQSLESNYQEDILKVKKIWKDIKQCDQQIQKKRNSKNSKKYGSQSTLHPDYKGMSSVQQYKKQAIFSSKNHQVKSPKSNSNAFLSNKYNDATNYVSADITKHQKSTNTKSHNKANQFKQADKCEVVQFSTCSKNQQKYQEQSSEKQPALLKSPVNNTFQEVHNLKKVLQQRDYELSLLRVNNQRNVDRIRQLEKQIQQKDSLISKLKSRENQLLGQTTKFNSRQFNFDYGKVEYENFKSDSKRLLKMLQATQEYRDFANLALDDNGVRFLNSINSSNIHKSTIDLQNGKKNLIHFCSCNKAFIPETNFWVPKNIHEFGREFIKDKSGSQITQAQLELLLYELNKIWREREKRILNSMNSIKALQIGKYQRKIQNIKSSPSNNNIPIGRGSSDGHVDVRLSNYQ